MRRLKASDIVIGTVFGSVYGVWKIVSVNENRVRHRYIGSPRFVNGKIAGWIDLPGDVTSSYRADLLKADHLRFISGGCVFDQ